MEWLALLVGIGIISSLFDKKSKDSSHSTKVTTPRKTNKWDSEIQGKGVVYGSSWDRIRKVGSLHFARLSKDDVRFEDNIEDSFRLQKAYHRQPESFTQLNYQPA